MNVHKPFGKLGQRHSARMGLRMPAELVLAHQIVRAEIVNISRTGACLRLDALPPRAGATVILKLYELETLGTVAWTRSALCGLLFQRPLEPEAMEGLRGIAEDLETYECSRMEIESSTWR